MIDRFEKETFESTLPEGSEGELVNGEWQYVVPVEAAARIVVRSTIDRSGVAADVGDDSIRLWIELLDGDGGYRAFSKLKDQLGTYTTRVPGWDRRLQEKLDVLRDVALRFQRPVSQCPDCGNWKTPAISRSDRNPDRPYEKCWRCKDGFQWLDEPPEDAEFAPVNETTLASGQDVSDLFADIEAMLGKGEAVEAKATSLNEQQEAIVTSPARGAWRVLAGPGSGKTRVMEERINALVAQDAEPGRILYVVFNKTMADEGMNRIGLRLMRNGVPPATVAGYQAWFCTIHAACLRMVKDWYIANNKRVPDVAKNWMIKKELDEIARQLWQEEMPTAKEIYSWICTAKHNNLKEGQDEAFYVGVHGDYHGPRLAMARRRFDAALRDANLLTFPDMMFLTEQLLDEDQQFREKWQSQFEWVLVDEAQDTNRQAMRILMRLAQPHNNFCIVGDQDQMMYRFAGAAPEENLFGFADHFSDGALFFLETNYRSTRAIVRASNELIKYNYQEWGGPYEEIYHKTLSPRPDADEGEPIGFTMYETTEEEARALAADIRLRLEQGAKPGDFFVGSRTRAQLGYLEPILTAAKIPFINITGISFWQLRHINQCVSYLRLVEDRSDREAFGAIYNASSEWMIAPWGERKGEYTPTRFLGKAFLAWCGGDLSAIEKTYGGYECRGRSARSSYTPGLDDIFSTVRELGFEYKSEGMVAAVTWLREHVFAQMFTQELDDEDSVRMKLDDIDTVADVASKFETIEEFLDYIDAAIQAAKDAKEKNWDEYVVLSTIHRLKGLQRPVVYGIGWCEGVNKKTGDPVGLLPHTYALTQRQPEGPLDIGGQDRIEDERCIAFVLVSRAEREVHLSGVRQWRNANMIASRFVREAGLHDQ